MFKNKVAVITGGGSGIGRQTALALGRAGAAVVIANRNREQGQAVVVRRTLPAEDKRKMPEICGDSFGKHD